MSNLTTSEKNLLHTIIKLVNRNRRDIENPKTENVNECLFMFAYTEKVNEQLLSIERKLYKDIAQPSLFPKLDNQK